MHRVAGIAFWVVLTCALALGFAWFDMPGHGLAFVGQGAVVASVYMDGHALFLLGMVGVSAVELLVPRWLEDHAVAIFAGCCAIGTVALALYCAPVAPPVIAASIVVTGFANVLFTSTIATTLLTRLLDRERLMIAVAVSLAAKTFLVYATNRFLSPEWQVAVLVATPVACALCALLARSWMPDVSTVSEDKRVKFKRPLSDLMLGAVLVAAIIFAATRVVSNMGFWGTDYPLVAWGVLPSLMVTAVYLAICYATLVKADSRLLLRFLPALLVLFASYSFLYSGVGAQLGLSETFLSVVVQYAELYGQTFMWAVLLLGMRTLAIPSFRVVGILFGTFTIVELILQHCLTVFSGASLAIVLFAFFTMFAVLVWALCRFYGKEGVEEGSIGLSAGAEGGAGFDCGDEGAVLQEGTSPVVYPEGIRRAIAERYGLSERETEVFLLLAQGRTRKFICDELFISEGTASSYTSRVYEKLGVRSKQELLTLVLDQEGAASVVR